MNALRKILVSSITVGILSLAMCVPLFAADGSSATDSGSRVKESINLQDASENMTMSDVLTFDELVLEFAKDSEISVDQARATLLSNYYSSGNKLNSNVSPQLARFRTFAESFTLSFGVSNSSNYFGSLYEPGDYEW